MLFFYQQKQQVIHNLNSNNIKQIYDFIYDFVATVENNSIGRREGLTT